MSLKFWSIAIPVAVVIAGAVVIYLDYSDRSDPQPQHDIGHYHEQDTYDHDSSYDTSAAETALQEPDSADMARILEIEEEIEQSGNTSLQIAYYGEMIQIYMDNDRLDAAGDAGYRLAELTDEKDDWINAADWFYTWLDEEPNETRRFYFAARAASAYANALEKNPQDYELRTDKAAALIAAGQPEEAKEHLELALEENSDYLDANYNLGVILYRMGSIDESISYLRRSNELAQGTERQAMVEEFLDQNDISLLQ